MNKSFSSISELMKYIEKDVLLSTARIGEEIKNVLRQNVNVLWYQRNGIGWNPKDYSRTYDLINSIRVSEVDKVGNSYNVKIYYDTDEIIPRDGTDTKAWTRHKSMTNGDDVSDFIPLWVEEGNNNSSLFSFKGVHPIQETKDWIVQDDYIKTRLAELLEMKGYNVL